MEIHIVSLFPEFFAESKIGLIGKAMQERMLIHTHHLRDFSDRKDRRIDDRPFGGGPGMLIQAEPIYQARQHIKEKSPDTQFIFTDPKGTVFSQKIANELANKTSLTFICGRYEGIDERAYEKDDLRLSLGDFVMSGGEIAALAMIDAMSRLLPGTLGNPESHRADSHQNHLLEHPQYTRPALWRNKKVPDVLTSGNHQDIEKWQRLQQLGLTWQLRPDLIRQAVLTADDKLLLEQYIEDYQNVDPDTTN